MTYDTRSSQNAPTQKLLILDDDGPFRTRLSRAMERRGFQPILAASVTEASVIVKSNPPDFAIIDMRLEDGSGLKILEFLKRKHPSCKAIVLTGYGNITSAVIALKAGAINFLAKPADADDIYDALTGEIFENPDVPEDPMSANRVRWEHIQRVFALCGNNVSETARRLKMHRRTLQRILQKRAPL